MTKLSNYIEINRRFARSARIEADLNGTPPLVGYVLQASVEKALATLALNQIESHQGAFTWTGPYGGGKSSAALLVANLIAGTEANRKIAQKITGRKLTSLYAKAFPENRGPWAVVAVTGSRTRLRDALAEAASITFNWTDEQTNYAYSTDEALINLLLESIADGYSGVLLLLDELGKLLEYEAAEEGDVHLLQDIAERSSRSEGKLVVVGILHQSFDQYAARASRDARQEWAKVQGRYQDIPFLSGADETVALLGQAIACKKRPTSAHEHAIAVAQAVAQRRPIETGMLADALAATWPLNPITALLLGPVSRQRFAQNERSVFGFLSSAEPFGFQEFINESDYGRTYDPAQLWDYLSSNFGMALASGVDGNRFSLAFEAIERAAAKGQPLHVELTKAAAAIEFFRNGSGLALGNEILAEAVPNVSQVQLHAAIADLLAWAVFIRQPRLGGYALFAGSDFDLEDAINKAIEPVDANTLAGLPQRVGLGFIPAKRHYFSTGALRTFEIILYRVDKDSDAISLADTIASRHTNGSGLLVLMVSDRKIRNDAIDALCKATAEQLHHKNVIAAIGAAGEDFALHSIAAELVAVERVFREHPQLEGDRIARRQIAARQSACIDQLHRNLEMALERTAWWLAPNPSRVVQEPLAGIASILADAGFPDAPVLKSELLQRDRLSSNAMAALRGLCHAIVNHPTKPELGITGYPAEMGLYLTVLRPFGLHIETAPGIFDFSNPDNSQQGRSLHKAWGVLAESRDTHLDAIYARWTGSPFGIKAGVMPALALAYLMANRNRMAVYIDGVFQTTFDDVFVDKLLQRPSDVRLKHIDRTIREAAFLDRLALKLHIVAEGEALPVARAVFQRFKALPSYAVRTKNISEDARIVRNVVLRSHDPEALLFEDLPTAFGNRLTPELIVDSLRECEECYPTLLEFMKASLARALGVDPVNFSGLAARADLLRGLTNDYNFDAFAIRAAAFDEGKGDIEGLVSLLLHKPARNWSDRDREQALIEMAKFGRRFRELETLAIVRDRRSQTEALAVVVGIDPSIPPLLQSFVLTEGEKLIASQLADQLLAALGDDPETRHLHLAALARAVASLAANASAETEAV